MQKKHYPSCHEISVAGFEKAEMIFLLFIYRRPTLYPLEIAVDFLKSL
jgi:hypothetical protein